MVSWVSWVLNLGDSWNLGHLGDLANVGILGQ